MTAGATLPADIAAAYRTCEQITGDQARNFAWGIRLLPGTKRRALSAVYAMARRIDDIGDGQLSAERKLAELAAARRAATDPTDPTTRCRWLSPTRQPCCPFLSTPLMNWLTAARWT